MNFVVINSFLFCRSATADAEVSLELELASRRTTIGAVSAEKFVKNATWLQGIATYPKVAFKLANIAMTTESNPCALGLGRFLENEAKKVIAWRFEFHKHQQHRFQSKTHSRRKKIDFVSCSRIVWHGRQQRLEEEEEIEKRIRCCCCLPTSNNQIHVLDGLAEKMNCLNYFFRQLPLLLFLMLMLGYSVFFR